MTEKRKVVVIGGGSGAYHKEIIKLLSSFAVVYSQDPNSLIAGTSFDKVTVDDIYPFNGDFGFGLRDVSVRADYEYHDQPKSQKPWKAGYIPQHNAGPSFYPSSLLLNLVARVK